jgi:hypothetical protein
MHTFTRRNAFLNNLPGPIITSLFLLMVAAPLLTALPSPNIPVVAKWGRFEQSLKSSVVYGNALQEATLSVFFTSPLGETNQVYGFWDGGKTWRVRFSPNLPGRWSFKTACSDTDNKGLHERVGEFICTAPTGSNRFNQHGPVRVAPDHRHFEHADGTPFFWIADTVWNGARVSEIKDWELYARIRESQKFTVAQWAIAPGEDSKREAAYSGLPDNLKINPAFFQRLDGKIETLRRSGILSAIMPLSEEAETGRGAPLPEEQAVLFTRYLTARWGADPVAWLVSLDTNKLARWKKIGQAVFGPVRHGPLVFYAGPTASLLDDLRDQKWVDAFGFQPFGDLSDNALKSAFSGPFAAEWKKEPARPLIAFAPHENAAAGQAKKRFTSEETRRAIYWGLLIAPPAGVSYGGAGIVNWDKTLDPNAEKTPSADLPAWHKAMFMPAAKQMTCLATFTDSMDFWRLRPQQSFIASQPGTSSPRRYLTAAGTEAKELSIVYVPEDRTIDVMTEALPPSPLISWLNPRTGEKSPAVAVVGGSSCQFPTPDPGDWLLVMKAGKAQ